jgi:hypothetical protein
MMTIFEIAFNAIVLFNLIDNVKNQERQEQRSIALSESRMSMR